MFSLLAVFGVRCLLVSVACRLLLAVRCEWFVAGCSLFVAYCTFMMALGWCVLFDVCVCWCCVSLCGVRGLVCVVGCLLAGFGC